jgi:hypothetical protein
MNINMKRLNRSLMVFKIGIISTLFIINAPVLSAKDNIGAKPTDAKPVGQNAELMKMGAGCSPATTQRVLDVNNVRTTILNGGDMWWNLALAKYEIPKLAAGQTSKNSLFSGALWIGGVTNGNIRVAAQTYRQSGNDYFPGPLTIGSASITADRCKEFDKIWSIRLTELTDFIADPSKSTEDIKGWPWEGKVDLGEAKYIAPFVDGDGDGIYDPSTGADFPSFDKDVSENIPDQMMFIIYNDKGSIHSETQGVPIGLELQTQAFAFSTNDEVNNMTFYRTKIINRSTEKIDSCIFGQWVDPDLGNYSDDYVECDIPRNLGICYNGDDNDEGTLGYGLNPPSVGVNFFQGPKRPDGTEIGLTKFVYYNNDFSNQGNPTRPEHYWGYLNGKDGNISCDYMFPGSTDTTKFKLYGEWTERGAGNTPGDRRFLQTAGPFSLLPGAVNNVTIGVVWARASSGGATGSFNLLKLASDKAFALFKNNFKLIAGPPAPKLEVVELNSKLLFTLKDFNNAENYVDSFAGPCANRTVFKFQGYQVFQLKTASIPSNIYDVSQAQLVAQFDIVDGVARLVNSIFDPELEENVKKIMVVGSNKGIEHSFSISKDYFETGSDQTLVNFKNYHYVAIAYAYATNCVTDPLQYLASSKTSGESELKIYSVTPHDPAPRGNGTKVNSNFGDGLPIVQLEGIGNGGNTLKLSKESINEALSSSTGYVSKQRKYESGASPVYVKIINPLNVPDGDFELYMKDASSSTVKSDTLTSAQTTWYVRHLQTGDTVRSVASIENPYEQVIPQWGLSISISQSIKPGNTDDDNDLSNGFISANITYSDPRGQQWLSGIIDDDPNYSGVIPNQINWIRAGLNGKDLNPPYSNTTTSDFALPPGTTARPLDPRKNFGKMIDGTWSPYCLASRFRGGPAGTVPSFGPASDITGSGATSDNVLGDLQSVQIVFTADKTKWSRCIVLESGEEKSLNVGGVDKLDIRASQSVDKNGMFATVGSGVSNDPEAPNYISETGMGWFPGYAINIETGERLNILFAEDSSMPTENGRDMIWNPTSTSIDYKNGFSTKFGGKHFVYVMGVKRFSVGTTKYTPSRYDECRNYTCLLDPNCVQPNVLSASLGYNTRKRVFFSQVLYTSIPLLSTNLSFKSIYNGLIPNDVTLTFNVKRPYALNPFGDTTANGGLPFYKFSTKGYAVEVNESYAKKALDIVNIVPNPYYAFSQYEDPGNALDTKVKITNLPKKCTVNIYTLDGVLVRRIKRDDDTQTYLEWDLKNDAKVPIVSGVYLIHINATDLGEERIIKWFGVMRPADYDSF